MHPGRRQALLLGTVGRCAGRRRPRLASTERGNGDSAAPATKVDDIDRLFQAFKSVSDGVAKNSARIDKVKARSIGNQKHIQSNTRRIDVAEEATRRLWNADKLEQLHAQLLQTENALRGTVAKLPGAAWMQDYEWRGYRCAQRTRCLHYLSDLP